MPETAVRPQKRAEGLSGSADNRCYGKLSACLKAGCRSNQGKENRPDDHFSDDTGPARCRGGTGYKSLAPEGMLAAVFEDDGRTGYFYALDESVEETRLWTQYTSTMPKTFQTVTFLLMLKLAGQKIVRSAYSDQWIPARGIRFRGKKRVLQEWLSSPINKVWSLSGHEWSDSVDDFFR